MISETEKNKIKEAVDEFLEKMTITASKIEVVLPQPGGEFDVANVEIKLEEPQILIGQGGQTLFEIQRLLKMVLNKKLQKVFYLSLDINDYKKKKIEYLQDLAKDLADEVALTKKEKEFSPMPAYERRAIHAALSKRTDIIAESQGEEPNRRIVIKPR